MSFGREHLAHVAGRAPAQLATSHTGHRIAPGVRGRARCGRYLLKRKETHVSSHLILIVEENEGTRAFLADQLAADGYEIC